MAKSKTNGAAPKKGPPDGALPLDEVTIRVTEYLTADEREAQAEQAQAAKDARAELVELEKAREKEAKLKAEQKAVREDKQARAKRYEQMSKEALHGEREVDVIARQYRYPDNTVHYFDPATQLEVGTPREATDADRQGAFPTRAGGEAFEESKGVE